METDTQTTGTDAPADNTQTADTVDAQASEASTQVDNAPEATQATEGQPEVNAEDTAEEKLYAGKYKSPEDMEKAYKELESKFGQTTSEKAQLTQLLNEAFTTPEASTSSDTDSYDDIGEVSSHDDPTKRDVAVLKFTIGHPDANGAAMSEVLANDPFIGNIQGYEAKLEYAYAKSQNMTSKQAIAEAQKQTAQQTQTKIVEKQAAQVESANRSEPTDEKTELQRKYTTGTPEERNKARLEYIRKHMV